MSVNPKPVGWTDGGLWSAPIGSKVDVRTCRFEEKGKVCGDSITRGILDPERWFHTSRMFNTSRIPVREALTRLEAQGLVATQRYRGAVVAALSIAEIQEIFEFRALLEAEVIHRSVQNISDETLALASSYCEAFGAASDPSKWGELNRLFHYSLYRDCGRPYYLQVVNTALGRIEREIPPEAISGARYQEAQMRQLDSEKRGRV